MIQTFTSLFKNKEIRSKIIFTLAMLFIYDSDPAFRFRA